ncbi:LytTR family transcriptional regulator DNA-binding domain-containing protein [Clostridium sp. CM027]|uniref:LytTR family DNA-binding domain-containing protein n=1 Tax=Clostridium sp. CM027 TaxID=2849865 RepID=UPI001C6E503B|nr:LytTR family DNA-binding domain-containing protein [Clostridium sp. CM027]MBW9146647.1 LytTR family transcriptional regulator DNA-binding domain-containing protein [Clostridium sp. CM027]UVE42032.1 LytTR family transcriptional regulator DNA-binding domain-containing protein [Clostridium sp. CM027]
MRIIIIEDPLMEDIEVKILCKERTIYVDHLAAELSKDQITISGKIENEYTRIFSDDIFYFEAVDNKIYIYCEKDVYQSDMKLYELEIKLSGAKFARINKSCLMNIAKLEKVKGQINGRLLATLSNGEKLIINRSYVQEIKRILEI